MFTIKHIHPNGEEALHASKQVRYNPADGLTSDTTHAAVWFDLADGTAIPLVGGTVFVMNEAGKTVARYDLGGWLGSTGLGGTSSP